MLYRDIIGQEDIKKRLRLMVNQDKLPHALMLSGRPGVGKLPLALATAQYLCCENRNNENACGVCPSCIKYAKLIHPDLHLVFPIIADKSRGIQISDDLVKPFREAFFTNPYITIDQWLNSISEGKAGMIYKQESEEMIRKLNLKSYESNYKVMLIWLPEKMNDECANKLLKILEEPYPNTHFLLVSDDPDNIIGTIRSRTQEISVPPISEQDLAQELNRRGLQQDSNLKTSIRLAQGSWSDLETLTTERTETHHYFELFVQMMRYSYGLNIKAIRQFTDSVCSLNREQQKAFLHKSQQLIRENFICRCAQPDLNYMQTEEHDFAVKFSLFIHEKNIEQIMNQLALAEAQIEQNANGKFVFFHLCLELYFCLHKPS